MSTDANPGRARFVDRVGDPVVPDVRLPLVAVLVGAVGSARETTAKHHRDLVVPPEEVLFSHAVGDVENVFCTRFAQDAVGDVGFFEVRDVLEDRVVVERVRRIGVRNRRLGFVLARLVAALEFDGLRFLVHSGRSTWPSKAATTDSTSTVRGPPSGSVVEFESLSFPFSPSVPFSFDPSLSVPSPGSPVESDPGDWSRQPAAATVAPTAATSVRRCMSEKYVRKPI
ncbi:hypothetical protein ACFQMM_17095 [Saliphagus sp. GCM10025308]